MSCTSLDAKSTFQAFNALKCVRGERPVTNPNDSLLKQLQQFEGVRLKGVGIALLRSAKELELVTRASC